MKLSFHADLLEGMYLAADETGYDVALSAARPPQPLVRSRRPARIPA
jgi:hypothetical protein